ncbi:MAG: hypothetical protein SFW36_20500 [Leptolyngbyaceae cyanobacterium bins.59]|nr:hypothetical protein [Leptolyngbyaceae cyanobacterium bins.59]
MKSVVSFFKKIRLNQVFSVLLAGFLFIGMVGCNGAAQATMPSGSTGEPGNSGQGIPGKRYQKYEGGMNGYNDVDPRRQETGSAVNKAKALRDNAERNVIDMDDDLGSNTKRILDKKGENLDQIGDNLKGNAKSFGEKVDRAAQDAQEAGDRFKSIGRENDLGDIGTKGVSDRGISRGTQKAADNIQANTKAAGQDLVDDVKSTARKVQNRADNLVEGAKRAID